MDQQIKGIEDAKYSIKCLKTEIAKFTDEKARQSDLIDSHEKQNARLGRKVVKLEREIIN